MRFEMLPTLAQELRVGQTMEIACDMAAVDNIFPRVVNWLNESSGHYNSLMYVARKKRYGQILLYSEFSVC